MHTPVLVEEVLDLLEVKKDGLYIDATVGEGGHLRKILELGGKVLAIDWDESQIKDLRSKISDQSVTFAVGNFAEIQKIAKENGFPEVDGVLFDLGLSMEQLARSGRGFSYKQLDDPLDMRIGKGEVTAEEIVNTYSEDELYEIFAKYGEELSSREIASSIVRMRVRYRMHRVGDVLNAIDQAIDRSSLNPDQRNNIYARIFQALRIAVNNEFENLRHGLEQAVELLKPEGRVVVITFHSREDRIVKQFVREHALKAVTKKAVRKPTGKKFERSAKVRAFTK